MKIVGAVTQHYGLRDELNGVLEDFKIRNIDFRQTFPDGSEDIFIYGLSDKCLSAVLDMGKPVIGYPCLEEWLDTAEGRDKDYKKAVTSGRFRMIINFPGLGNLWHEMFPDFPVFYIPYAFNRKTLPIWNGSIKKVLVLNQNVERLKSFTDLSLDEILESPYYCHSTTQDEAWLTKEEIYNFYADYGVMFYFNNHSYSLTWVEALTTGIPMVTFNKFEPGALANVGTTADKIGFYCKKILQDDALARQMHRRNLAIVDEFFNFDRVKKLWRKNIEDML